MMVIRKTNAEDFKEELKKNNISEREGGTKVRK